MQDGRSHRTDKILMHNSPRLLKTLRAIFEIHMAGVCPRTSIMLSSS